VLAEVRSAAEHLTLAVTTELSAINDPEARDRADRRPRAAHAGGHGCARADRVWQQVLNEASPT